MFKNNKLCINYRSLRDDEEGVVLLLFVALVIVVTGIYSSIAFQQEAKERWNINYALGQQFAIFSKAAHHYAQDAYHGWTVDTADTIVSNRFYDDFGSCEQNFDPAAGYPQQLQTSLTPTNAITVEDLICRGYLPPTFNEGRAYDGIDYIAYATVVGQDSPAFTDFGGTPTCNAPPNDTDTCIATAVAIMEIDVAEENDRKPSDSIAFQTGASDFEFIALDSPEPSYLTASGDTCGLADAIVIWGSGDLSCLSESHIDEITRDVNFIADNGVDQHWVFGATWEAAISQMDTDAVFRYPQPLYANLNILSEDVDFQDSSDIVQTSLVETDNSMYCDEGGATIDDPWTNCAGGGGTVLGFALEIDPDTLTRPAPYPAVSDATPDGLLLVNNNTLMDQALDVNTSAEAATMALSDKDILFESDVGVTGDVNCTSGASDCEVTVGVGMVTADIADFNTGAGTMTIQTRLDGIAGQASTWTNDNSLQNIVVPSGAVFTVNATDVDIDGEFYALSSDIALNGNDFDTPTFNVGVSTVTNLAIAGNFTQSGTINNAIDHQSGQWVVSSGADIVINDNCVGDGCPDTVSIVP